MRYHFKCDCGYEKEVSRPIKDGPPKTVKCKECKSKMYQEFGGNFILKGSFPGKDITREKEGTLSADDAGEYHDKIDKIESTQREILKERRKGKNSFENYTKRNKTKVETYYKNAKKYGYGDKDTSVKKD